MVKKIIIYSVSLYISAFAQLIGPKISVKSFEHNFGDIVQGEEVSHSFVITNSGGDILKITGVRASCGCTAAEPDKKELKPGESTNIKVTFNSKGRIGPQVKSVYVSSNDPDRKEIQLNIRCNIVLPEKKAKSGALLYVPETQFNFGQVKEGEVVSHTFQLVNKGQSELEIKDIKTSCGCTAAMLSSSKLKPGETGTLKVDLDTKNRIGKMSRTITIVSNDVEQENKVLTIFAEVLKN
jgi:uncharacterized cupredoxin-like copper-binding protein